MCWSPLQPTGSLSALIHQDPKAPSTLPALPTVTCNRCFRWCHGFVCWTWIFQEGTCSRCNTPTEAVHHSPGKEREKKITLSVYLRAHYIPTPWGIAGTSFSVVVYNRHWELSARKRERRSVFPSLYSRPHSTFRTKAPQLKHGEDSK